MSRSSVFKRSMMAASLLTIAACAENASSPSTGSTIADAGRQDADDFLVVDCLLPSQVRQLGRQTKYLAPRRAIKTSGGECEIRGGEYVSYDRADIGTALKIWLADAEAGDPQAMTYVGEIFERGVGGTSDYESAAIWYQRAVDQGFKPAMINLGQLYEQGRGVEQDEIKAINYYRQASGLGVAFVATEDTAAEIENLQTQLSARDQELADLKQEVGTLEAELQEESQQRQIAVREASEREQQLKTAQAAIDADRQLLTEKSQDLPPDAAQLVAERQRLDDKARALAQVESSLGAWREQLARQEERLAANASPYGDPTQLAEELALARLELANAKDALRNAEAAQARATDSSQEESARLEQLQSTLEAWGAELERREARLATATESMELQKASLGQQQAEASDWLSSVKLSLNESQSVLQTERNRLSDREQEIASRESELSARDQELEARLAAIRDQEAELAARYQEFEVQQASYSSRQQELARLDAQIAALNSEAEQKLQALAVFGDDSRSTGASTAPRPAAAASPTITMIDPPITVASGEVVRSVPVRANVAERAVIGSVASDEPVISVLVNDTEVEVNERGVFRTVISIDADRLPVSIVAIDQSGHRSTLDFAVEREASRLVQNTPGTDNTILPPMDQPPVNLGTFHALVIGNNAYTQLPKLETAGTDARDVAEIFRNRYGMEVNLLLDATRYDILSALNNYRANLNENDNLVVYYAGHGELDEVNQRGHWLPVDAELNSTANWISNVQITDILNAMSAKRVLVVADSCYSGALTRSSLARLEAGMTVQARQSWIEAMATRKARMALTSGSLAPVLDGGGGDNSIFAKAFVDVLRTNNDVLEGQRLHQQVAARVTYAAEAFQFEQIPLYAPIKFAGHESGEFFFVPRG